MPPCVSHVVSSGCGRTASRCHLGSRRGRPLEVRPNRLHPSRETGLPQTLPSHAGVGRGLPVSSVDCVNEQECLCWRLRPLRMSRFAPHAGQERWTDPAPDYVARTLIRMSCPVPSAADGPHTIQRHSPRARAAETLLRSSPGSARLGSLGSAPPPACPGTESYATDHPRPPQKITAAPSTIFDQYRSTAGVGPAHDPSPPPRIKTFRARSPKTSVCAPVS